MELGRSQIKTREQKARYVAFYKKQFKKCQDQ